jgi:3'(2'), 5'-bisphosphate nucleotidase
VSQPGRFCNRAEANVYGTEHRRPIADDPNIAGSTVPIFDSTAGAELLQGLTALGVAAATAILGCRRDSGVRIKADGSPVTPADETADAFIRDGLARLAPRLPVVSEEQAQRRPPAAGADYFLVDPLDGTREFIAGRDEYTVNIGLISDRAPALGVIVAPALGLIWRGTVGRGAERLRFSAGHISEPQPIYTRARPAGELIVMVSRSHLDAATRRYLDELPHTQSIACGSSIKFCRLAEGAADHYPRLGPTHDWDVAAGHAILAAAGGSVVGWDDEAIGYGTPELLVPAFFAWGGPVPTEGALKAGY